MKGLSHFELVWCILPAAQNTVSQFAIPDQPRLRYARITAITSYCVLDVATIFPGGTPLVTAAQMPKLTLVLESNDPDVYPDPKSYNPATGMYGNGKAGRFTSTQQNFKYVPYTDLHRTQSTDGVPFVRQLTELENTYITWDKSYVQVSPGGLGNVSDVAVGLGVWYSWRDQFGNFIPRN